MKPALLCNATTPTAQSLNSTPALRLMAAILMLLLLGASETPSSTRNGEKSNCLSGENANCGQPQLPFPSASVSMSARVGSPITESSFGRFGERKRGQASWRGMAAESSTFEAGDSHFMSPKLLSAAAAHHLLGVPGKSAAASHSPDSDFGASSPSSASGSSAMEAESASVNRRQLGLSFWRKKLLVAARLIDIDLKQSVEGAFSYQTKVGYIQPRGLAFALVDPNLHSMVLFISDLAGDPKYPPTSAQILHKGVPVTVLPCSATFVAKTSLGFAFAGVIPISAADIATIEKLPSDHWIIVTMKDPLVAFGGPILSPKQTAQSLPSLLLPAPVLQSAPSDLASSLNISFNLEGSANVRVAHAPAKGRASVNPLDPPANAVLPGGIGRQTAYPQNSAPQSVDLTPMLRGLAFAVPAAFQAIRSSVEIENSGAAASAVAASESTTTTTLAGFMQAVLPALPAMTERMPSVGDGQLLEAGSAALMATVIAYAGFMPPLDSPGILSAIAASLNEAMKGW